MFLSFLSKLGLKEPFDEVLGFVKQDKYDEALLVALANMKKEERVRYVANFITKSHWRINSAALEIFNNTLDKYFNTKDAKVLDKYLLKLETENRGQAVSSHSRIFQQIRGSVVNDLIHDDPARSAECVIQTFRVERYLTPSNNLNEVDHEREEREHHQKYVTAVIEVIDTAWPKKNMLKTLYG